MSNWLGVAPPGGWPGDRRTVTPTCQKKPSLLLCRASIWVPGPPRAARLRPRRPVVGRQLEPEEVQQLVGAGDGGEAHAPVVRAVALVVVRGPDGRRSDGHDECVHDVGRRLPVGPNGSEVRRRRSWAECRRGRGAGRGRSCPDARTTGQPHADTCHDHDRARPRPVPPGFPAGEAACRAWSSWRARPAHRRRSASGWGWRPGRYRLPRASVGMLTRRASGLGSAGSEPRAPNLSSMRDGARPFIRLGQRGVRALTRGLGALVPSSAAAWPRITVLRLRRSMRLSTPARRRLRLAPLWAGAAAVPVGVVMLAVSLNRVPSSGSVQPSASGTSERPGAGIAATAPAVALPAATMAPAPAPPAITSSPTLRPHEIFGFAPYWTLPIAGGFDLRDLTTVAYFGVDVAPDGSIIGGGDGWAGYQSQYLAQLISAAHFAGDRVVLTAKSFDQGTLDRLSSDPTAGDRLGSQLVQAIQAKAMDGANLDFEGLGGADRVGMARFIERGVGPAARGEPALAGHGRHLHQLGVQSERFLRRAHPGAGDGRTVRHGLRHGELGRCQPELPAQLLLRQHHPVHGVVPLGGAALEGHPGAAVLRLRLADDQQRPRTPRPPATRRRSATTGYGRRACPPTGTRGDPCPGPPTRWGVSGTRPTTTIPSHWP